MPNTTNSLYNEWLRDERNDDDDDDRLRRRATTTTSVTTTSATMMTIDYDDEHKHIENWVYSTLLIAARLAAVH